MSYKRYLRIHLCLFLILTVCLNLLSPSLLIAAQTNSVAKLVDITGEVFVKKGGGQQEFSAFDNMIVSQGDWIRTDGQGSVTILYQDGTEVDLDANTEITVEKLISDGNSTQSKLKLWAGSIWNKVKSLLNIDDQYSVETPTAVMGVRGTLYLVTVDQSTGEVAVDVVDGKVAGHENRERTDSRQEYLVTMGQELSNNFSSENSITQQAIDVNKLTSSVQPELIVKILSDANERIDELVKKGHLADSNINGTERELMQYAVSIVHKAVLLTVFMQDFITQIRQSNKASQVDTLLKTNNQSLELLKDKANTLVMEAQELEKQVIETSVSKGFSQDLLNDVMRNAPFENTSDLNLQQTEPTTGTSSGDQRSDENNDNNPPQSQPAATPAADPGSRTVDAGTMITLTTATEGASIRYTTGDGSQAAPTLTTGILYDSAYKPIINETTTLKAVAFKEGMLPSAVGIFTYSVQDLTLPDSSQCSATSTDNGDRTATIEATVKNAGGEGITNLTAEDFIVKLRGQSYVVSDAPTLKNFTNMGSGVYEVTFDPGFAVYELVDITVKGVIVKSNLSIVIGDHQQAPAATPAADPISGAVDAGTMITLTTATEGASIRYTTGDGSQAAPTLTTGILYDSAYKPIINETTTIKAVAFKEGMSPSEVGVFTYTVPIIRAWSTVGNPGFSDGRADFTKIVVDHNGVPYAAYMDEAHLDKVTVMKFINGAWVTVGNPGFTEGRSWYVSLFIDKDNVPYVAYQDGANGSRATVMKYNENTDTWETVGQAGFTPSQADYLSLFIDKNGIPYLAFTDYSMSQKITVMKYSGGSGSGWAIVGNQGFSTGGDVVYNSLFIDDSGTPYAAFRDGYQGWKGFVFEYNGETWSQIGNEFSSGITNDISLFIQRDQNTRTNDLFVAYSNGNNPWKAILKKYNGDDWIPIGSDDTGFTAEEADNTVLFLYNGIPYVVFTDKNSPDKVNVMRYSTSDGWQTVGTAEFSDGAASYTDLYIANGTLYVIFSDEFQDGGATVMKYPLED